MRDECVVSRKYDERHLLCALAPHTACFGGCGDFVTFSVSFSPFSFRQLVSVRSTSLDEHRGLVFVQGSILVPLSC